MAVRTNRLLKAEVGLAMHVAIVRGLNKKLEWISLWQTKCYALIVYLAPMATLLHRKSLRGDVNSLGAIACPVRAICINALAPRRSTIVYNRLVAKGWYVGFGRRENSGSRSGA